MDLLLQSNIWHKALVFELPDLKENILHNFCLQSQMIQIFYSWVAEHHQIKGEVNPFWHAGPYYSSEQALFNGICHAMRNMSGFWENWSQSHNVKQNKTHASENCSTDSSYQIESVPPTAVSDQLVFKFRLSQKPGELHIVEPTQLKIDRSFYMGHQKGFTFP